MKKVCFHCGETVPDGFEHSVCIDSVQQPMCCFGCAAVAQTIVDSGMVDFYRKREGKSLSQNEKKVPDYLLFDKAEVQRTVFKVQQDKTKGHAETCLIISGLRCVACVWLLEKEINAMPGVVRFSVNSVTRVATLIWYEHDCKLSKICQRIDALGYDARPYSEDTLSTLLQHEKSSWLKRLGIGGLAMMQVMMFSVGLYIGYFNDMDASTERLLSWASFMVSIPVVFYCASPFFSNAVSGLKNRSLNVDIPVSLALGITFFFSCVALVTGTGTIYFDSVVMFTFFLVLGRYFEAATRAKQTSKALFSEHGLPVFTQKLVAGGAYTSAAVCELKPGDTVRVGEGECCPVDGLLLTDIACVDESLLSGESLSVKKHKGQKVYAGTTNGKQAFSIRVTATAEDTYYARIVQAQQRILARRVDGGTLVDKIAPFFVLVVLCLAFISGLFWYFLRPDAALWIGVAVLVASCPCALSLAAPAVVTNALGLLTQGGLLVRRKHVIESLSRVNDIVFDKTGTLTHSAFQIEEIACYGPMRKARALEFIAALERLSTHPIASAFNTIDTCDKISDFCEHAGGVSARINGVHFAFGNRAFIQPHVQQLPDNDDALYLVQGGRIAARVKLVNNIRPEADYVCAVLRKMGKTLHVLSGDDATAVNTVANALGIEHRQYRQSPEQKLSYVQHLQNNGRPCLMVGDGFNDNIALSAATIAFAMNEGAELTRSSADAILLFNRLDGIIRGFRIAYFAQRLTKQSLLWAIVYNLSALPIAMAGYLEPYWAALGMSASSLLVVLNASRLASLVRGRWGSVQVAEKTYKPAPGPGSPVSFEN